MATTARALLRTAARRHGLAVAAYLALALLMLAPSWFAPGERMPGHPHSDLSTHLWGYWWFGERLLDGRLPLHIDRALYPDGGSFYLADPIDALLFLPVRGVLGPVAAYTAVVLFNLLFACVAGYAAALRWIGDRAGAFLAGAVFGCSTFALSCIHSGTLEYMQVGALPLFALAFEAALLRGGARRLALATAAWALVFLCSMYFGIFAAFAAAAIAAVRLWHGEVDVDAGLRRAGLVYFATAVVVAPLAGVVLWTLSAPDSLMSWESSPGWEQAKHPVVDVLTFVAPFDYQFPDMEANGIPGILHANSLGWVAMALAAFGAWRDRAARRWLPVLLVYGVLMLGPQLTVAGKPLEVGGVPVLLPLGWLMFPGSPLAVIHHPHRMVVFGMLFLGLLAGYGLTAALRERSGRIRAAAVALATAAVVGEALWLSPAEWPLPYTELQAPAAYRAIADDPADGAVLDLPQDVLEGTPWYLIWATVHGRAVAYWIDFYVAGSLRDNDVLRAAEDCLHRPQRRRTTREGRILEGLAPPRRDRIGAAARELEAAGFGWVVLHRDAVEPDEYACYRELLDRVYGEPATWPDGVDVYALPATAEGP